MARTKDGSRLVSMRSRVLGLLVLTVVVAWTPTGAGTSAQPAQTGRPQSAEAAAPASATPLRRSGLPRLAMVTTHLYRGGQPDSRGFKELKTLGVELVVNLRHEPDEIVRERALADAQGLRYASIPWRGKEDPRPEQVAEFLDLLRANANTKVFVHCERGSERTGVMIACYRMTAERWTPDRALAEMELFGFRGFWFGHLKRFVREFPALMTRNAFLRPPGS
jgi:protein tyrosine phosphatase (PTP) superfamily phosphohydrolase (DUF442 family)